MERESGNQRQFGDLKLDLTAKMLWHKGEPVPMPLKELELLCLLVERSGELVTKDELLDRVWEDSFVEESNLSRHIYLLRKKLSELGADPGLIENVPRRGYRFTADLENYNDELLVIDKRTTTRALIEIQETDAGNSEVRTIHSRNTRWVMYSGLGIVLLMLTGFGLYYAGKDSIHNPSASRIQTMAVLPVSSFGSIEGDDDLGLRITDALVTRLGSSNSLTVRPTSTILRYRGVETDPVMIGNELKVDAVLVGRLQREENQIRVTFQLVSTASGESIWSDHFDGMDGRLLSLQDVVVATLFNFLGLSGPQDDAGRRPTNDPDAYEAYLRGRFHWNMGKADDLNTAVRYFESAVELDPQFAEAHAGLADAKYLIYNNNIEMDPKRVESARADIRQALRLKPDLADALVTLGTIQTTYDWDWRGAETSLARATSIAPNLAPAWTRYGILLIRLRRFDEARRAFERALELDPSSQIAQLNVGIAYFCKKDLTEAERRFREVLDQDEQFGSAQWFLARSLWLQGRKDESVRAMIAALQIDQNDIIAEKLRLALESNGPNAAVEALLYEWRDNPSKTNPHNLAYLWTYLENNEMAIYWLKESVRERHPWTTWIASAPEFEVLRDETDYQDLVGTLGLGLW